MIRDVTTGVPQSGGGQGGEQRRTSDDGRSEALQPCHGEGRIAMSSQIVNIPGLGDVEFPDSMSADAINAAAKRLTKRRTRRRSTLLPTQSPPQSLRLAQCRLHSRSPSGERSKSRQVP